MGEAATILPDWPAAMSARLAAQYVSLSESSVHTLTKAGKFPRPINLSVGRLGWRRTDLDRWVEQGGVDGWAPGRATVGANPWE